MTVVVDAATVVAALVSRRGGAARERLATEPALHAPHLLDIEVLSALRALARRGSLSTDGARQARGGLALLPIERYPQLPLAPRIWELRDNLTCYDAAYVALAEALGATLVTSDAPLSRAPGLRCPVEFISDRGE